MNKQLLTVLIACLALGNARAADFSQASIDVIKLSESISFLRNNSVITNPSSVISQGTDGVLLIDTGIVETQDVLAQELIELTGTTSPRFVVNTHFHADHTGGNTKFESATLIAHPLLRKVLMEQGLLGKPVPESSLPDLTADGTLTLYFNGEPVRLIGLSRGHTLGDMAVLFESSNVLVTGDYYFYNTFPIIDLENGGSLDGYLANIQSLLLQIDDATRIVPGHTTMTPVAARVASAAEYRQWYAAIADTIGRVRAAKRSEATLADVQADPGLRALDAFTPLFFSKEKWLKFIYESV